MIIARRWTVLVAFLLSLSYGEAIRGRGSVRRRKDGSLVFEDAHVQSRDLSHWGGVAEPSDAPPARGGPKSPKVKDIEEEEDPVDSEREIVFGAPAPAAKRGKGKNNKNKDDDEEEDGNTVACDDIEDPLCQPECDDPEDPLCTSPTLSENTQMIPPQVSDPLEEKDAPSPSEGQDLIEADFEDEDNEEVDSDQSQRDNGDGQGLGLPSRLFQGKNGHYFGQGYTSSYIETPTTIERSITPFKIAYALTGDLYEDDLDDGDYAELSDSTDLFLTQYFDDYFTDEPTGFVEIDVLLQKTGDPLIVRFFVTATFTIPGNVPTMTNLFDRMNDAFSGYRARQYISILNGMGTGNPFKNTRSISLINETPVSAMGSGNSGGTKESPTTNNTPKLVSIIVGAGVLALVIAGLVWVCRKSRQYDADELKRMALDDDQLVVFNSKEPSLSKAEANAIGYLQRIRNRYRDDAGSKTTDMEEVSLDDHYGTTLVDHGMVGVRVGTKNEEADKQNTTTGIQDAIREMNALSSTEESYPAPPSDCSESDDEDKKSTAANGQTKKADYLDYLDLKDSFEEEDLRIEI